MAISVFRPDPLFGAVPERRPGETLDEEGQDNPVLLPALVGFTQRLPSNADSRKPNSPSAVTLRETSAAFMF
jgi:hypothetical protein